MGIFQVFQQVDSGCSINLACFDGLMLLEAVALWPVLGV